MRIREIITESQDLNEGPILNKIGTGIGKGVGTAAKAVGAVAGGIAGIGKAIKKGFQAGKSTVGSAGDDDEATTSTPASVNTTPATGVARSSELPASTSNVATKQPTATSAAIKPSMKTIKSSVQALPKNQRAQLRKIVAAKAGVTQ